MSTIREQLRTTFMGLAGLLTKMNVMQGSNPNASNTAILEAVSDIDIDTTEIAKQGDDSGVTLTGVDNKIDDFYYSFDADIALQLSEIIGTDDSGITGTTQSEEQVNELRTLQESYSVMADVFNSWISSSPSFTITNDVTDIEIQPNMLYIFVDRTVDLNITLAQPIPNEINEYHFMIYVGNTVPTITLPASVDFGTDIWALVEPNKCCEISILNNEGIACQW